ncbi:hypothetical protein KBC31_00250 [Candidatus Saccharibacteria bacterium]|nr:hypothetical protein [Candidatus Saccharibacteria bacterium]
MGAESTTPTHSEMLAAADQRLIGVVESLGIFPALISLAFATNCGGAEGMNYPDLLQAGSIPVGIVCAGIVVDGLRRVFTNTS